MTGTGADVKIAEQISKAENPWAILFIFLLLSAIWLFKHNQNKLDEIYRESRTEAKEREKALLIIIERQNDSLQKINETQEKIQERIEKLEDRFDSIHDIRSKRTFQPLEIGRN
ncbi:DUF948 domain-containing protein [Fictibacillus sp. JL2B1089]|uniref:DUF948 domain-containing protein n=1 Tax=Fictibacillus sp. JL2B1089 TaxID=3399565 RepID=UPI003A87A44F